MARQILHESTTTLLERSGSGRWKAVLITPGQGSSGFYSESMLRDNAHVFNGANVVKNYFKHPKEPGEQRDPRDQWGYVEPGTAQFKEGVGIVGEINVLDHWRTVVESLGKAGQAPLSVYVAGETDEAGNVTTFYEDVKNSVDLVDYPGRPGSGLTEQMLESARSATPKPAAASAEEKEGKHMEKEALEAIKQAIAEALAPLLAVITENKDAAAAQSQAEADADAVETAVEEALANYEERIAAIDAATDLSPKQVESLRAAAKQGDIAQLLEDAKAIAADFTHISESHEVIGHGRVVEAASKDTDDFTVHGFGGLN